MAFGIGLSFGKKSSTTSGSGWSDKVTDLNGTQNSNTTTTGTTNQQTNGLTQTDTTGRTSGLTTADNTTNTSGTQTQSGTTSSLSADVQAALEAKVMGLLGGDPTGLQAAGAARAGFNVDEFVNGMTTAARNRGEQTLQEQTSAFGNRAGGSTSTNSAAALLAQRGRNDLEANIAGINAQARAQGEGIANQNLEAQIKAQAGATDIATNLTSLLKGATTTSDVSALTSQIEQLIGKGSNLQSQTQSETAASEQSQTTNQLLSEIANILTQQQSHEVGKEQQTQTTKSGGFGLSLGI